MVPTPATGLVGVQVAVKSAETATLSQIVPEESEKVMVPLGSGSLELALVRVAV
jgi:hypothetical protein